jgi:hypothetical protein
VKQKGPVVHYPGYDVLEQRGHWDEATRQVVLDRMHNIPTIKYFTLTEVEILQAVCDRVMPQDDRPKDQRIAIVPWIDQRCHFHLSDGTRFEEMPPDEIAWRWGLEGIDQTSWEMHGRHFVELGGGGAGLRAGTNQARRSARRGLATDAGLAFLDGHPDAPHRGAVLCPPLGLERDRLWRPGLPSRLCFSQRQSSRALGSGPGPSGRRRMI